MNEGAEPAGTAVTCAREFAWVGDLVGAAFIPPLHRSMEIAEKHDLVVGKGNGSNPQDLPGFKGLWHRGVAGDYENGFFVGGLRCASSVC